MTRAKSKGELLAHLKTRGVEEEIAHAIIFRLQEAGLVDDADFAKQWATSRHNFKKISKRTIASELRQKGVLQEEINEALSDIDDESEYRSAFDLGMKKFNTMSRLAPEVQARRVQSLLQRKGFGFAIISRVLRELDLMK